MPLARAYAYNEMAEAHGKTVVGLGMVCDGIRRERIERAGTGSEHVSQSMRWLDLERR